MTSDGAPDWLGSFRLFIRLMSYNHVISVERSACYFSKIHKSLSNVFNPFANPPEDGLEEGLSYDWNIRYLLL